MYLRHFNENDYLELTKYYMPNLKEEQFKQIIREWNLLKYKNKFFEIFDSELQNKTIGMHTMENTATVFLKFEDLYNLLLPHGNEIRIIDL